MPVKRSAAGSSTNQKKARFAHAGATSPPGSASGSVSAGEDDLLEDDLQQGAARDKQRARRSLKDQDGYGSDSSNDEEGVVPSRRPGAKAEEDDDVDMFADDVDDKEKDKGKGKGKGKEKEFMDINEIEGQEFERPARSTAAAGEQDSDSEEERARESKGTGLDGDMGAEITPFNMKSEMDQGRFTADGEAYMENDKDPNDKHDMWLEDLDKEAIKKARRAHREREKQEQEREEREATGAGRDKELSLMREAVDLMQRGETVLEALQRLGFEVEEKKKKEEKEAGGKKKSWAERQKERKKLMAVEQEQADSTHTSNPFTNLSNIVSALTATGHLDVYSLSRESIQRMLPAAPAGENQANGGGVAARPPPPPSDKRQFQYRFSMAYVRNLPEAQRPVEREVFGPFPALQLKQWRNTGFFGGPACENVELRSLGDDGSNGPWGSWADIVDR
ncbi:hypothetical protein IAU60_005030 [Kwoniella sp. DSM 27419]